MHIVRDACVQGEFMRSEENFHFWFISIPVYLSIGSVLLLLMVFVATTCWWFFLWSWKYAIHMVVLCDFSSCDGESHIQGEHFFFLTELQIVVIMLTLEEIYCVYLTLVCCRKWFLLLLPYSYKVICFAWHNWYIDDDHTTRLYLCHVLCSFYGWSNDVIEIVHLEYALYLS